MTTLITGSGLIGRLTAELLVARGEAVVLADLRDPALAPSPLRRFEHCDITDAKRLDEVVTTHGVTQVVHTAAMLSTGIRLDPVRGLEVNILGLANVLECARQRDLRRVVCASSTTVGYPSFGSHDGTPIEEDLPARQVSERPASIYAMTKLAGEHLALLYADLYRVDTVVLRYAAVLGSIVEPPSSVPGRLFAGLVQSGRSGIAWKLDDPFLLWGGKEEFVDARDCARANLHALDAERPRQRVYNIAPGSAHSLDEFIATLRLVYPALDVEVKTPSDTGFAGFPHVRPAPSSTEAAARELGFGCRYALEQTFRHWGAPQ